MANVDNRKHLSLLESIHSEGESPKGRTRRAGAAEARGQEPAAAGESADLDAGSTARRGDEAAHVLETLDKQELRMPAQPSPTLRALTTETISEAPVFELPGRRKKRSLGGILSFLVCVLVPTILAGVYYFAYASDQYVVKFSFVVRDTSAAVSMMQSASASNLIASMGGAGGQDVMENYMVTEYMTSSAAVAET